MADIRQKVFIVTLGCDKNTVDSDHMAGNLLGSGFELTRDPSEAAVIIVNTCCFIEDAKKESIETIFDFLPYRTQGDCRCFIVAGCMAERYARELEDELPEVDYFVGVGHIPDLSEIVGGKPADKIDVGLDAHEKIQAAETPRYMEQGQKTAYLKISDGCDHHCTYCVIPKIRGRHVSRKPQAILEEARALRQSGVEELILVAQDLTQYGSDLAEDINLAGLLTQLAEAMDFHWIRLLYLYPEGIDEELLQVIADHPSICHYFDIPIQHTESSILKRMGRCIDKAQIYDKVKLIRDNLPDAVLRTTVITGFPGETEEDFTNMLASLEELRFDRLGAFAYSREEGTPAHGYPDQVDEDVKAQRVKRLYDQQQPITGEGNGDLVGQVLEVIIDEAGVDGVCVGRTRSDAPEVDCSVIIERPDLERGRFYLVRIVDAIDFDLIGEVVESEFTE